MVNEKRYENFIESLRKKNRKLEDGYFERHHILPRSLGGGDDESNIISLSYREHYIAHYMLWKIYKNKETLFSFWLMNNVRQKIDFKINSRIYEDLKTAFIKSQEKKVICLETGKVYDSMKKAALLTGTTRGGNIKNAIEKKTTSGGFHWDFYSDNVNYTKNRYFGKDRKEFSIIRLEDGKKYRTYKEAANKEKMSATNICDAVTGKIKTAGGYHWSKYNDNVDYTKNRYFGKSKNKNVFGCKKVICVDTGKIYISQQEAARDIGYKISSDIGRCCDGKLKSCGGFIWRRYEDKEN